MAELVLLTFCIFIKGKEKNVCDYMFDVFLYSFKKLFKDTQETGNIGCFWKKGPTAREQG